MTAKIIPFNKEPESSAKPVKCSFCGTLVKKAFSSQDNVKHVCFKCLAVCAERLTQDDEEIQNPTN